MNVQIQKSEVETSAASKDMQEITTHVAVNWRVDPTKVTEIYENIGDEDDVLERIISPAVAEALKAASSKRTAEEIQTNREKLKEEIDLFLEATLTKNGITLKDVFIVNLTF